jgi:hypothetical protein
MTFFGSCFEEMKYYHMEEPTPTHSDLAFHIGELHYDLRIFLVHFCTQRVL